MKLTYVVTEDIYAEAIRYQRQLQNSQSSSQLRFWGMNLVFAAAAVWFFLVRTAYPMWLRILPLLMAAALIALSAWRRSASPARVKGILRRYIRQGALEEGFLGEHTLLVENGKIRRKAGKGWQDVNASEFGELHDLDRTVLLVAGGVILDTIPRETLDSKDCRRKLLEAIALEGGAASAEDGRDAQAAGEVAAGIPGVPENEIEDTACWNVDQGTYVRGMVEGHRRYYSTLQAWRGSQLMRIIVLLYGIIVLALRLNIYIGAAFLLIGILLNRQLLITFSPLSYQVVSRQFTSAMGTRKEPGKEIFYRTGRRLGAVFLGQKQETLLSLLTCGRTAPGYTFLYSKEGQMYVFPDLAFSSEEEKNRFLRGFPLK